MTMIMVTVAVVIVAAYAAMWWLAVVYVPERPPSQD